MRYPIEATRQPRALEQLIPEQETKQGVPQYIFRVEDRGTLAPKDAGDACFGIAAMGVIDRDNAPGAQQLGVEPRTSPTELSGVEIGREEMLAVACGVVDHPLQELLGSDAIAVVVEHAYQTLVAIVRRTRAIKSAARIEP